jgi:hypothetical protein
VSPEDASVPDYLGLPLGRFLDLVASREPAPGGGAVAYGRVLDAYRPTRDGDEEGRRRRIQEALSEAADVPLSTAEIGAEGDMGACVIDGRDLATEAPEVVGSGTISVGALHPEKGVIGD